MGLKIIIRVGVVVGSLLLGLYLVKLSTGPALQSLWLNTLVFEIGFLLAAVSGVYIFVDFIKRMRGTKE